MPTSFHLGPLTLHTYGFGLAIAFYVAYWYAQRRLTRCSLDTAHFGSFAITMFTLGIIGARVAHVATNWGYYSSHAVQIFSVWQGGLSSFGGIVLAAPVGYLLARQRWPEHRVFELADTLIPAVVLGWALGRFLGPQFMVAGGGHETHQWFGLHYAGQHGARVPVPLIQGLEDGALWLSLMFIESRRQVRRGVVTAVALIVWGVVRSVDERLLLGEQGHTGSIGVQLAGVVLALFGCGLLVRVALERTNLVRG